MRDGLYGLLIQLAGDIVLWFGLKEHYVGGFLPRAGYRMPHDGSLPKMHKDGRLEIQGYHQMAVPNIGARKGCHNACFWAVSFSY